MSAAASALTSLFASDEECLQHESRVELAFNMKREYHFLFSDCLSDNPEVSFSFFFMHAY
jgi:hypothetical protein